LIWFYIPLFKIVKIDTLVLTVLASVNCYNTMRERDKMKIALVIDRFLPRKGGGERYVQILAKGLAQEGHDVTIFARRFPVSPPNDRNIHYHVVKVPGWPGFLRVLLFARRCQKEAKKGSFDIVHDVGHMVGADIFNPHGGVEQVWLQRYFASYHHPFHRFLKRIQRLFSPKEWAVILLQKRQFLSDKTRHIIAISPMIKTHIRSRYHGVPEDKITIIQNPTDLSRFKPENRHVFRERERNKLGLKNDDIAILFAGNNFRLKGLYPLIQSLTILEHLNAIAPFFKLLVAGNENPSPWKRVCERAGVGNRVAFLGPVRDMERLYAASDIFALPTYYDSASLVVLEALASGLPVITSVWNGASFLIDVPAAGVVLNGNDNPEEIARALYAYFPGKKREKALEASPKTVIACSLEYHVDQILEIYREVIKKKAHG